MAGGLKQAGLADVRPISPLLLPNYARQPYDYLADYTQTDANGGQVKIA